GAGLLDTGLPRQITLTQVSGVAVAVVGFAPYSWSAPLTDLREVARLVRQASGRAEIVVVTFHGGAEGAGVERVPVGPEFAFGEHRGDVRAFSRVAIDNGAGLVLGSGPHVLRGMEFYRGALVA